MRHEELRKQYVQDRSKYGDRAHLHWEYKANASIEWRPCVQTPEWAEHCQYRRKPTGHPHAALMAQYARDATTHERPWELWQIKPKGAEIWHPLRFPARWCEDQDYRRKPKLHTITLTTDQLREVILACEYPDWENEDFTSAVKALMDAALRGAE